MFGNREGQRMGARGYRGRGMYDDQAMSHPPRGGISRWQGAQLDPLGRSGSRPQPPVGRWQRVGRAPDAWEGYAWEYQGGFERDRGFRRDYQSRHRYGLDYSRGPEGQGYGAGHPPYGAGGQRSAAGDHGYGREYRHDQEYGHRHGPVRPYMGHGRGTGWQHPDVWHEAPNRPGRRGRYPGQGWGPEGNPLA